MRLESRSQPPEAGGKQKSRNGHQEASIHEKTSYEAVNYSFNLNMISPFQLPLYIVVLAAGAENAFDDLFVGGGFHGHGILHSTRCE